MDVIQAKTLKIFGYEISWWGFSQWYKWRWNITHIDFGVFSVYGIKDKSLPERIIWRIVSIFIKPMRIFYHWRYVKKEAPGE